MSTTQQLPTRNPDVRPVKVDVCQVCRLLWSDHLERARRELASIDPAIVAARHLVPRDPTLADCVELLKLSQRGPEGRPGRDARGDGSGAAGTHVSL